MKNKTNISSLINLALHYKKNINLEKNSLYDKYIDKFLENIEEHVSSILEPSVLQGLIQLDKFDAVSSFFDKRPELLTANSELRYLHGHALLKHGRIRDALRHWSEVKNAESLNRFLPIRSNQLLKYPEASLGNILLQDTEPEVHVLILTHNREKYLRNTLSCLAKTLYSNYRVYIVDNGSSDSTRTVLQSASDFFPSNIKITTQSLPTNIGRPAGHNWLITNWNHSSAEYIAILDDDMLDFEPHWLRSFINTFTIKPNIGAVGGKTIGHDFLIQDATSVILPPSPEGYVCFHTNRGETDWGQYNYISNTSDYIIGCASAFKREIFDTAGLFDIRFSPSQGVDIDHGLRMRKAGYDLMYNGNCTFVHAQLTSVELDQDRPRLGNSLGNFLKLGYKYSAEEFQQIICARLDREKQLISTCGEF
jgi:GT2 family glycosyltransferase